MRQEILLVDDDRILQKSLKGVLEENGYAVRTAANANAALTAVAERRPDLVVLDVMMPGRSGLEVCRELRARDARLPILFLTALGTPDDEIRALACGGDVYVPKTAPDEVLLARIAALLRLRGATEGTSAGGAFDFGDWHVDSGKLEMRSRTGRVETLKEREVAFLRALVEYDGTVIDRDTVISRIWAGEDGVDDNRLSVFVYTLRKKLGRSGAALVSVRGVGYAYRP